MEERRLKELIQKGESAEVEFKESLRLREPIGQAVSGFSNATGGTILLGTQKAELPPLTSGTVLVK